jgi:tetratricopeptide (TPR) repeat protein
MKHHNREKKNIVTKRICEFEASLRKGTVVFQEKADFMEMINLCDQESKWQLGILIAERAFECHPYSEEFLLKKAELMLNCNMIEESFVTISEAEKLAPYNINLRLLKAELLAMKGQNVEAIRILNESKSYATRAERSEIYLLEAHIYEYMKQHHEAFAAIRRCLLADPTNNEAYQKALMLSETKGYFNEALELYNRILDIDAYNWRAWMNIGYAYSGLNKFDEAIEAFEYTFAINEKCKEAYLEAGSLMVLRAQYHRAIAVFENALFDADEDASIMQQLGICYEKLKEYSKAGSYYKRSSEIDPFDAETMFRMGRCYAAINQWPDAVKAYIDAIDLEDWREEYHAALGEAYFELNELSKAYYSFKKAASLARHDVYYLLNYVTFLMNIGQVRMALRALQQAEKDVDDPQIQYLKAACLYEMGKRREALYNLREVLQSDYAKYPSMFKWRPGLANDADIKAVIESFNT